MNSAERLCLVAARSEALLADFVVLFLIRWGMKALGVDYVYFQPVFTDVSTPITFHDFTHPVSALFWGGTFFASGLPQLVFAGMWVLYGIVCLSIFGQTIGMRQAGIKLVDAQGKRPGLLRVIVRQLVRPISSVCWIGYWPAGFTANASTLHDVVSGTRVVYSRKSASTKQA